MGLCATKTAIESQSDILPSTVGKKIAKKSLREARADANRVKTGVQDAEEKIAASSRRKVDADDLAKELAKLETLEENSNRVDNETRIKRLQVCKEILIKFPQAKIACINYDSIGEDDEVLPPFWFFDGETNRYINALTGKKLSRPPDWSKAVYQEKYCVDLLVGFEEVPSKSRPGKKVYQMLLDQRARLPKKPSVEKLTRLKGLPPGWKRVPSRSRKGKWVFLNRVSLVRASKDVLVLIASAMDIDCEIPDSDEEWSMGSQGDLSMSNSIRHKTIEEKE